MSLITLTSVTTLAQDCKTDGSVHTWDAPERWSLVLAPQAQHQSVLWQDQDMNPDCHICNWSFINVLFTNGELEYIDDLTHNK